MQASSGTSPCITQLVMNGEYMKKVSHLETNASANNCAASTHMVASLCDRTSCGADTMPRWRLEGEGGERICKAEDVRAGCMTDRSCGC